VPIFPPRAETKRNETKPTEQPHLTKIRPALAPRREPLQFWILAKRLEAGAFSWPKTADPSKCKLKLAPEALALLMNGIDMKDGCMRPWYERA
jgi:hypothetical protein